MYDLHATSQQGLHLVGTVARQFVLWQIRIARSSERLSLLQTLAAPVAGLWALQVYKSMHIVVSRLDKLLKA